MSLYSQFAEGTMHPDTQPQRRSIRLPGYDYSLAGEYFVTLCTRHRALLLDSPRVRSIVRRVWQGLPGRFPGHVELDAFVIMPNHIHGILVLVSQEAVALEGSEGGGSGPSTGDGMGAVNCAPTPSGAMNRAPTLGEVVRAFKAVVTHDVRRAGLRGFAWQRGYYEHIIEDEAARHAVRWYIEENPARWQYDPENPQGAPDIRERMFLRRIRSRHV
jgi:putative transposase